MRSKAALLVSLACLAHADTPPLTQTEMQQVLRTLQTQFADPRAVDYEALNRAAIAGLLKENARTIQIISVPATPAPVLAPTVEQLTPRIMCMRPHGMRKEDADALRTALTKLAGSETSAVILDLRAPAADGEPALAVDFAALFLPKGSVVLSALKTTADPVWTGEVMLLVDGETTNAGEILAAVLQSGSRAVLAGGTTRGRTAAVVELPLRKTDTGTLTLRYTAQRVIFPDGVPDPFGKGVIPEMPVPQNAQAKAAAFALQTRKGLACSVFQTARPRTNEAALVARTNPEIPARVSRTAGQAEEGGVIDRPLQAAVDAIIARQALNPK